MTVKISPIIKPEELKSLLDDIILIDARTGPSAKANYVALHLAGARFVDLDEELSGPKDNPAKGGRHPLPGVDKFGKVLGRLGITPQSHVVVYDDKNGANAAARFWWMLRSAGHEQVQVLDGGFQAAVSAGIPTSSKEEAYPAQTNYAINDWKLPMANIDMVEKVAQNPDFVVIDVREAERFRGEREPIDLVAGHIPGAVNIPYSGNLNTDGSFLSPGELKEKYLTALKDHKPENVIVHCGSGVTACHTILAMDHAGIDIPALYVGSWSEWSRTNRPVATENIAKSGE